jgi:hypothetical protein
VAHATSSPFVEEEEWGSGLAGRSPANPEPHKTPYYWKKKSAAPWAALLFFQ